MESFGLRRQNVITALFKVDREVVIQSRRTESCVASESVWSGSVISNRLDCVVSDAVCPSAELEQDSLCSFVYFYH